jgi:hypothetical protein
VINLAGPRTRKGTIRASEENDLSDELAEDLGHIVRELQRGHVLPFAACLEVRAERGLR